MGNVPRRSRQKKSITSKRRLRKPCPAVAQNILPIFAIPEFLAHFVYGKQLKTIIHESQSGPCPAFKSQMNQKDDMDQQNGEHHGQEPEEDEGWEIEEESDNFLIVQESDRDSEDAEFSGGWEIEEESDNEEIVQQSDRGSEDAEFSGCSEIEEESDNDEISQQSDWDSEDAEFSGDEQQRHGLAGREPVALKLPPRPQSDNCQSMVYNARSSNIDSLPLLALRYRNRCHLVVSPNKKSYQQILHLLGVSDGASLYFTLAAVHREDFMNWSKNCLADGSLTVEVCDEETWTAFLVVLGDWVSGEKDNGPRIVGVNVE